MFRTVIFLSWLSFLTACSTSSLGADEPTQEGLVEIDVEMILQSSFEEVKSVYGDPVEEDHLMEVVDGELFETTPYYQWDVNGYRLEVFYDGYADPFLLKLMTEPLLEKDSFDFFDEIGVSKPYIPSDLSDESLYAWEGSNGWSFVVYNYLGDVREGATGLVVELDESR